MVAVLRSELDGNVLWLTFDRPERLNAFTGSDYRGLRVAIEAASTDEEVRCIVVTGSGRAFSAGADRSLFDGSAGAGELELAAREFPAMLEAFGRCEKPVLAAVNGLAVGIGCTLLLHCDLALLAASARLRTPFTELGTAPEAASSVLLPARASVPDAVWMLLSSEWVDADQARSMGLAWRVVADDELISETARAAAVLAARDPRAVAAAKRLLSYGRADLVRAAIGREVDAAAELFGMREPPS